MYHNLRVGKVGLPPLICEYEERGQAHLPHLRDLRSRETNSRTFASQTCRFAQICVSPRLILFVAIDTLARELHFFTTHPRRCQFYCFVDFYIAGAAAEISG